MIEPDPTVTRFVRGVVRAELARGGGASHAAVAQRTVTQVHEALSKLIGPAGVDVLLARSLVLARRAHPVLAEITAGPHGALAGLDDAARDGSALEEATVAVLSHFVQLLILLIGEDLAMRLVREVWPAVMEEK